MKDILSKAEVVDVLPPEVLSKLSIKDHHIGKEVSPVDLLTPDRFDILADTIYAQCHLLGTAQDWAQSIYRECKKILREEQSDLCDGDSIVDNLHVFHDLVEKLKTGSFQQEKNFIPVDPDDIIIDSGHQFAASLLCDQPIKAIQFDNYQPRYDYIFFLTHGLPEDMADAMALTFTRLCPNMAVVVVFPIASGKDDEIRSVLYEYGRIAYQKEVRFTKYGQYNLISLLYFNMHWIDPNGDINYGVRHHVDHRFVDDNLVKFIFVIFDDPSQILEAKTRLRNLFDLKNFPVHINDTHDETIWIAEHILTPNSIYFMNHAQPWFSKKFMKKFQVFSNEIKKQELNKDNFCLTKNAMLAAYGLRDSRKIDYLIFEEPSTGNLPAGISCRLDQYAFSGCSMGDLIFDPRNYFYFRGMKFISPQLFSEIGFDQKVENTTGDFRLIGSLEDESLRFARFWRNFRFYVKISLVNIFHFDIGRLRKLTPKFLRKPLGKIYRTIFGSGKT